MLLAPGGTDSAAVGAGACLLSGPAACTLTSLTCRAALPEEVLGIAAQYLPDAIAAGLACCSRAAAVLSPRWREERPAAAVEEGPRRDLLELTAKLLFVALQCARASTKLLLLRTATAALPDATPATAPPPRCVSNCAGPCGWELCLTVALCRYHMADVDAFLEQQAAEGAEKGGGRARQRVKPGSQQQQRSDGGGRGSQQKPLPEIPQQHEHEGKLREASVRGSSQAAGPATVGVGAARQAEAERGWAPGGAGGGSGGSGRHGREPAAPAEGGTAGRKRPRNDLEPAADAAQAPAEEGATKKVKRKRKQRRQPSNPFVAACLRETGGRESGSDDDWSDLEDFIVCQPERDYLALFSKKYGYAPDDDSDQD
ncbi:hypothetical protein GPECTOR_15g355 [Gonium pectorale]|uniref:Uncharacterized protein n=1 Tax=Gonium pectorale TaxID=33097 RepID=A0A150GLK2_GONPE|nr:hypothetical protein GPECTOR_15g355 [Gonium pectorale]|eukprot:KXZ50671.1 hypothetical protein GPECTOR_15g355 [Gonium pectorale]